MRPALPLARPIKVAGAERLHSDLALVRACAVESQRRRRQSVPIVFLLPVAVSDHELATSTWVSRVLAFAFAVEKSHAPLLSNDEPQDLGSTLNSQPDATAASWACTSKDEPSRCSQPTAQ